MGNFLPENILDIVNTVLTIGCLLGVVIDPTTKGASDSDTVLDGKDTTDLLYQIE